MNWLRDWDWTASVERHRKPLRWVVMTLFAMAGLVSGAVVETLPRQGHRRIVHRLLGVEAAVRRLIVLVMRAGETPSLVWPSKSSKRKSKGGAKDKSASACVPAFRLFDSRKYVGPPKRKAVSGYGPRIWNLDGPNDPAHVKSPVLPDDPVPAVRLCLRLLALKAALDDLPAQAERLRKVLKRISRKWPYPMRRGRPPGSRARGKAPIDEILEDCQTLAIWAFHEPEPG